MRMKLIFESKLYIYSGKGSDPLCPMMRKVSLEIDILAQLAIFEYLKVMHQKLKFDDPFQISDYTI